MSLHIVDTLLVEDEIALSVALKHGLTKMGLTVRHATNLKKARAAILISQPQLIVLDRNLPDGDGLTLCKELRAQGFSGSILMLTAESQTSSIVQGLREGADDYLPKPFSWEELSARIEALDRRTQLIQNAKKEPNTASLTAWKMDLRQLRVYGPRGQWTTLTPLEFKLLKFFTEHPEIIISRDELLKEVWGFSWIPKTRTVDLFLNRMRKMFEKDEKNPRYFLTIRGAGYQFNPSPVSSTSEPKTESTT